MIKSDNDWYKCIGYMLKRTIYSRLYTSTYDVRVHMLLPKRVLVHTRDDNDELILLPYVSTFYATFII